ncbi:MAG: DNA replication/repair protein RecF [Beijerinckiaceae bacterium]
MSIPVRIRRLMLTHVRSYAELDWRLDAPMVALAGENGAGKTNILEAISLFAPGRGLRRSDAADVLRAGAGAFAISAQVEGAYGLVRLGFGFEQGADEARTRVYRIDGEAVASSTAFADHLRMVWLTPDMDGLFRGPAGDRRRFLDRLVLALDATHGSRVNALERALRSRNRLLEDSNPDSRWLDAIEHEIAELALAVTASRLEAVEHLAALARETPEGSPFPWAGLALAGGLEQLVADNPSADAEDHYRALLRHNRDRDRAAGRTLIGPQASDLLVRHGPKNVEAVRASTGEQKALLIGLVLAHAQLVARMTGIVPLILLDEIAAHLDPRRRAALYAMLAAMEAQVWMTGADPALFADMPAGAQVFSVTPGRVEPLA